MRDGTLDLIYWIGRDADDSSSRSPGGLGLSEFRFTVLAEGQLEDHLERLRDEQPVGVVIASGVEQPLRVARQVYRYSPLSQIIFLATGEELASLRGELSLAPMIGTYWTIVEPEANVLRETLERAGRVSRQRRHLRTTLDRINVRLRGERPPRDSAEYRKLVVSDRYLAAILEHAPDAIVSLDPGGRVATWNQGAARIFGVGSDEAGQLGLQDLVVPEERERVEVAFGASLEGKPTIQMETIGLRRPEDTFIAEVTLAPVRDEVGAVIAVSLTARDVTERKHVEQQLREMQSELELTVDRRTQELSRAVAELEAFTYSASHDLRAPLRGIDGFSQALLDDYDQQLDETGRAYLSRIRSAARRMGEIIDSLLLLSRISQAQLEPEQVDLSEVCRLVVAELREAEPERTVEVEIEPDMTVVADGRLLRVAIENLLGNAWKFTGEREVGSITVGSLANSEIPTFFVRDNGAGFDMEFGDKLFVPFQRLHDPRRFPGTGIGLGTVQRVIDKHGGRVWARGAPESGATFYFELPAPGDEPGEETEPDELRENQLTG